MSGGVIDIYGICMRYLCRMDGRLSFQISMFVYSREREVLGARGGRKYICTIGLAMSNVAALSSANNECLRVPQPPLSPPSTH